MSGDLWGLLPIDDARLGIFCADVCGHGNAVAPHTRLVHTLLHLQPQNLSRPDQVLGQLNRHLYALFPRGRFAAMFYGVIDFAHDQLDYACSTFMPPLYRSDLTADFSCLNGEGFPLGFLPEAKYELRSCRFAAGAGLVIYSDALVETPLPPHAIFTPNTLCNLANESLSGMSAYDVNSNLIGRLNLNQNALHDDLTLITVFRKG
ncbi:PP2C family protein-serine/threonine phosphatase [Asticcacaulis benevestitus]|uniref:PP2C family protein-serine/threonine phosphatase n=1 Tax=Asticcacaulis benevestitus TaxID=347481 RepID=UPI0012FC0F65|nr:PP2C family protein-serine/threonine phosphatase [Asticcacaulis benevestitus]